MADYTDDFTDDFDIEEEAPPPSQGGYLPPALHRLDWRRREKLKKRRRKQLSDIYNTNLN